MVVAVAVVAAHALVTARAERLGTLAGEDDHADRRVVAGELERVAELEERAGPERVAHLGPADRDLGDAVGGVVADVGEAVGGLGLPLRAGSDVRVGRHCDLLRRVREPWERSLPRSGQGNAPRSAVTGESR